MEAEKKPIYVYVAGPLTQPNPAVNVRKAIEVAEDLLLAGFVPFVPHLTHFWELFHEKTWEQWLEYDEKWLAKCDALLRMPGQSPGAEREVAFAEAHGIPVFYSLNRLLEWKEEREYYYATK